MKKQNWKIYAFWILFTELVGFLAGLLTREGTELFNSTVQKPPLSPPEWLFPVAWAVLYALMGVGAARVSMAPESPERRGSLRIFLVQLGFNFIWSLIFFNAQAYGLAFLWLIILWALIVWMTLSFREVDRTAAWLQLPYLLWVFFAGYLNYGVWRLNG